MRNFGRVVGLWAGSLVALALLVWGPGRGLLPGAPGPTGGNRPGYETEAAAADAGQRANPHADSYAAAPGDTEIARRVGHPGVRSDDPAASGPFAGSVRRGPLIDEARVLTDPQRRQVLVELRRVAARTGVQMAVWTTSLAPQSSLTESSLAKAEALRLGRRDKDDGLLLSVAPAAREARLEVGYGLEGVLPDARCAQLLRTAFAGATEKGAGGTQLLAAVVAVRERLEASVADGSLLPPERRPDRPAADRGPPLWPFVVVLLLLLWLWGRGGGGGGRRRRGFPLGVLPLFGGPYGGGGGFSAGSSSDDTRGGGGNFGGGGASSRW